MFSKVAFENFKCLRNVSTTLERLTVFVGANGSGKTSILQAIEILGQCFQLRPPASILVNENHEVNVYCRSGNGRMLFEGFNTITQQKRSFFANPKMPENLDEIEDVSKLAHWEWKHVLHDDEKPSSLEGTKLTQISDYVTLLSLNPGRLAAVSYSAKEAPRMSQNGDGLATVLAMMKLTDDKLFSQIEADLKLVIPAITRVSFRRKGIFVHEPDQAVHNDREDNYQVFARRYIGYELLFDTISGNKIPANLMSEGTLLTLGILTAIQCTREPRIVLIDDIDRALHPTAQQEVIGILQRLQESFSGLQIVATTHSPYLVDKVAPSAIRIVKRDTEGNVRVAMMSEHPDFNRWKDELMPGEFWSMIGEKWIGSQSQPVQTP